MAKDTLLFSDIADNAATQNPAWRKQGRIMQDQQQDARVRRYQEATAGATPEERRSKIASTPEVMQAHDQYKQAYEDRVRAGAEKAKWERVKDLDDVTSWIDDNGFYHAQDNSAYGQSSVIEKAEKDALGEYYGWDKDDEGNWIEDNGLGRWTLPGSDSRGSTSGDYYSYGDFLGKWGDDIIRSKYDLDSDYTGAKDLADSTYSQREFELTRPKTNGGLGQYWREDENGNIVYDGITNRYLGTSSYYDSAGNLYVNPVVRDRDGMAVAFKEPDVSDEKFLRLVLGDKNLPVAFDRGESRSSWRTAPYEALITGGKKSAYGGQFEGSAVGDLSKLMTRQGRGFLPGNSSQLSAEDQAELMAEEIAEIAKAKGIDVSTDEGYDQAYDILTGAADYNNALSLYGMMAPGRRVTPEWKKTW